MRHRPLRKGCRIGGRGGCPHPPATTAKLLRLLTPGARSWSNRMAFRHCPTSGSGAEAGAIDCTTRAGCEEILPGSVSRSGGPGAGDWSACTPRSQPPGIFGSFHPWKEHEKEDSAAPAAGSFAHGGKGTKTPFLVRPLRQVVPSGGQTLSGIPLSFRATGPWRDGGLSLLLLPGPPGLHHAVWLAVDGGPMRHRPLPQYGRFSVGGGVLTAPQRHPRF